MMWIVSYKWTINKAIKKLWSSNEINQQDRNTQEDLSFIFNRQKREEIKRVFGCSGAAVKAWAWLELITVYGLVIKFMV